MSSFIFNAVKNGHLSQVKQFVENSDNDLYIENYSSYNLAQIAIINDQLDILKFLLDVGFSPNIVNSQKLSLLKLASVYDRCLHTKELIQYGANLNYQDHNGLTALHFCSHKNILTLQMLLENGAIVDVQDKNNQSTLHSICSTINHDVSEHIELLIQYGANVNLLDKFNSSPLHIASYNNNHKSIAVLLQNGCHFNLINNEKKTALDIAVESKSYESIMILNAFILHSSLEKKIINDSNLLHKKNNKI